MVEYFSIFARMFITITSKEKNDHIRVLNQIEDALVSDLREEIRKW